MEHTIELITNEIESGDWAILKVDDVVYDEGHKIDYDTFIDVLNELGCKAKLTLITDEQMEELC